MKKRFPIMAVYRRICQRAMQLDKRYHGTDNKIDNEIAMELWKVAAWD